MVSPVKDSLVIYPWVIDLLPEEIEKCISPLHLGLDYLSSLEPAHCKTIKNVSNQRAEGTQCDERPTPKVGR